MSPIVAFDIGSTLIHPSVDALAGLVGGGSTAVDRQRLGLAFAYALEADQRSLPEGDRASRQGQELCFRLFGTGHGVTAARAREIWLSVEAAGGVGSSLYTTLDPDAHLVLATLRERGCRLVAASNSDGTLEEELESFGLAAYFDCIVDSHSISLEKPDPRFFAHVLSLSGGAGPRGVTWYIGNDPMRDVLASLFGGFDNAVLYDPATAYPKLESRYRLTRLVNLIPLVTGGVIDRSE